MKRTERHHTPARNILLSALLLLPLAHGGEQTPRNETGAREVLRFGAGSFKVPETVIHDEREDVYIVSNVNGGLTAPDDNGFISRVSPEGEILNLKWIDGASGPQLVLHGPKDMFLTDKHLVVVDVGALRYFHRDTGEPSHSVELAEATLPNAVTRDDEAIYVSDTGGRTKNAPGAIWRIDDEYPPEKIASGTELERPNGIVRYEDGLVYAPFAVGADQLYRVGLDGKQEALVTIPEPQLDGLVLLPDGSFAVTSWKGRAVYRVRLAEGESDARIDLIAGGIQRPAQIGYDRKRNRLLVPSAMEGNVRVYALDEQR